MKIRFYLAAILFTILPLMSNCQGQPAKKLEDKKQAQPIIEHLTKTTFKQKVFDFEVNKQWKYANAKKHNFLFSYAQTRVKYLVSK